MRHVEAMFFATRADGESFSASLDVEVTAATTWESATALALGHARVLAALWGVAPACVCASVSLAAVSKEILQYADVRVGNEGGNKWRG
jgi:aminoglycoside phosphotransferase (APT) family kinase protein